MTEQKKEFSTKIANVNDIYVPLIERQLSKYEITFSEYSKKCVLNAITAINQVLESKNINWNHPQLDQSNLNSILIEVASLELNAAAEPRECYFQLRNVNTHLKDAEGKDIWKKVIEFNIEGDGNDAILSRFGRNVKKVFPHWIVREDDLFEYPKYKGMEIQPPSWEPRGNGKVVRIVYPILDNSDIIHFYIGEREDVKKNLIAHINNNLMNETFGIAKDKYSATEAQNKKIADQKKEIMDRASSKKLDEILKDEVVLPYISPAWKEEFSREEMIIRKIRNNIVKKIPKDFGNMLRQDIYSTATDENYRSFKSEVIEGTATEVIDITPSNNIEELGADSSETPKDSINTLESENVENTPNNQANIEDRHKPDFD